MPEKTCSICKREISLINNPSGLVFNDEHFVCEDCCTKHSEEKIISWTKNIMQSPDNGMPIGLWLIHEQNKDKFMMITKKSD
jgi:hypothetical protein